MREHRNRSGVVLLGTAIALIMLWVAVRLVILLGPARVTGAIAHPEEGMMEQFMAFFPDWVEHVGTQREWSLHVTQYLYAAALITCAIWVLLAMLLIARHRYARVATFAFIGVLAVHSIVLRIVVPDARLGDAFSFDGIALYLLLALLLTRRSVVSLFQRERT